MCPHPASFPENPAFVCVSMAVTQLVGKVHYASSQTEIHQKMLAKKKLAIKLASASETLCVNNGMSGAGR